jgi:arabinofuranosyltransferase
MLDVVAAAESRPVGRSPRIRVEGLVLAAALAHAWWCRWLAEDAYISMRYARNWAAGQGLVFNPGERVEGFTNFLWTALLALGARAGVDLESFALGLGLACTAGAFCLWIVLWRRLCGAHAALPFGLVALAANYSWASFATSGLELPLLSLLLGALICLLGTASAPSRARAAFAGVLFALAVATRPDALLFAPSLALLLAARSGAGEPPSWLRRDQQLRSLAVAVAAFAVLSVPFTAWRVSYYGDWLPNTFYVKVESAWWGQGVWYVWELLQRYSLWLYIPVAAVALARALRRPQAADPVALALALYAALHTLYVARIGGDFMEARFLALLLPFAYLLLERELRAQIGVAWLRRAALASLVATSAFSPSVLPAGAIERGVADERSWAPFVALWKDAGRVFGEELPAGTWVATDAIGAFGYASGLPLVDVLGLVDREVARQPVARRLRPGHDKVAPVDYLERRGAALLRVGIDLYQLSGPPSLVLAGDRYYLLSEDPAVAAAFERAIARLRPLAEGN